MVQSKDFLRTCKHGSTGIKASESCSSVHRSRTTTGVEFSPVRVDELCEFLGEEQRFSRDHVNLVVRRMGAANLEKMQVDMDRWLQS